MACTVSISSGFFTGQGKFLLEYLRISKKNLTQCGRKSAGGCAVNRVEYRF
jgi:hypothetical protein